jgi:hypothetical protein
MCYKMLMRTAFFLLAYLAGIHGFTMFAGYALLVLVIVGMISLQRRLVGAPDAATVARPLDDFDHDYSLAAGASSGA